MLPLYRTHTLPRFTTWTIEDRAEGSSLGPHRPKVITPTSPETRMIWKVWLFALRLLIESEVARLSILTTADKVSAEAHRAINM